MLCCRLKQLSYLEKNEMCFINVNLHKRLAKYTYKCPIKDKSKFNRCYHFIVKFCTTDNLHIFGAFSKQVGLKILTQPLARRAMTQSSSTYKRAHLGPSLLAAAVEGCTADPQQVHSRTYYVSMYFYYVAFHNSGESNFVRKLQMHPVRQKKFLVISW